jgi:polysaccharide biosynthesis/export protein
MLTVSTQLLWHLKTLTRLKGLSVLVALCIVWSGCSSPAYVWYHEVPQKAFDARLADIKPGDKISVFVEGQDTLSGQFDVTTSGDYPQPLVGSIQVAGLSPEAAAKHIASAIGRFVQTPVVQVGIAVPGPNRITVLGEVAEPGLLSLAYDQTLLEAIASAGGLTPFADEDSIFVVRVRPKAQRIRFKYSALVQPDVRATGFSLEDGDTIFVE